MAPKLAPTAIGAAPQGGLLSAQTKRQVAADLGKAVMGSDGRRAEYSQLADDSSGPKKEGLMLLADAEKRLDEADGEECLKAATDALEKFKAMGAGGKEGVHDALRVQIHAHMLKAIDSKVDPDDALKIATEEGKKFKDAGDKRGEGIMALSEAEVKCDFSGKGKRDKYPEGMDKVGEALALFKDAGDKKMEAIALRVQGFLHFRMFAPEEATEAMNASLALFEELGDNKGKAKVTHALAVASMLAGKFTEGIKLAQDAVNLFKDSGDKILQGIEDLTLGRWAMIDEDHKKALAASEEAMGIFQELGCGKGWEGVSIVQVTDAMIEMKKAKDALKFSKDAVPKFKEKGDWKGEVYAQDAMTRVHLAMDAPEKAQKTIEDAKAIVQEKSDKAWDARLSHSSAAMHLASKNFGEAIEALQGAIELADEAEDEEEQAAAQRALSYIRTTMPVGDYKEALKAASAARDLSQQAGDKFGEASDTLDIAIAHAMLEDNNKALSSANEAQELFQELKDPRGESSALQIVAELKMLDKKTEAALEAADERLTIAKDLGDVKLEAKARHQIATLHLADENFTEAEKVVKEATACASKAGDGNEETLLLITLVQVHMAAAGEDKADRGFKSNCEKAVKAATDAVAASAKATEKGLKATALYMKAIVMMWSDKFQDAGKTANEAKSIFLGMGSDSGEAKCLIIDAQLKVMNGNENGALDTLDRAMGLAKKVGDDFTEYEAASIIQQIQGRRQQFMPQQMMPMMAAGGDMAMAMPEGGGEAAAASVAAKPKGLDPAFVRKQLMTFVKDVMASDDELELDSPFMEAGMDSLSSVSLMSMVAKEFQMALSPSLVFDFPTVRALEDHLVEESKNA